MKGRGKRNQTEAPEGQPAEKKAKTQDREPRQHQAQERAARRRHAKQDTMAELMRHVLHEPILNRQALQTMVQTLAPRKFAEIAAEAPIISDEAPFALDPAAAHAAVAAITLDAVADNGSGSGSSNSSSGSTPATRLPGADLAMDGIPMLEGSLLLSPSLGMQQSLSQAQMPAIQPPAHSNVLATARDISLTEPGPELKLPDQSEPSLRLSPLLSPSAQSSSGLSNFSLFPASPSSRRLSSASPDLPELAALPAAASASEESQSAALSRLERYTAADFSLAALGLTSGSPRSLSPLGSGLDEEPLFLDRKPSHSPGLG